MFWDFFTDLCKSVGKSPHGVCRELGFSNATATHWKNQTMPNGEALIKIADYFGVPIDFLLGREMPDQAGESLIGHKRSHDEMHKLLDQLSDENLVQLKDFMEFLYQKQCRAESSDK